MHRRAHKRGSRLNILITGPSGCGKSTLINSLCGGKEVASTTDWMDQPIETASRNKSLQLKTYTEDIIDADIGQITLRIIEANGLYESLDNTRHITDLKKYLEGQFDEVLAEESRIKRNPRFTDNRVHALIYMIEPTGHGLRETDIMLMKQASTVANIIPVLAKSDTLTKAEILLNKRLVREDLEFYDVPVFQFLPDNMEDVDQDDDLVFELRKLQDALPFAVVASNETIELAGDNYALVRKYPWGMLHIEDPKISDFAMLRDILLSTHTQELKENTLDILYEQYRTLRLSSQPDFNAAKSAAAAPMTASRYNLAGARDILSSGDNSSQSSLIPPLQPKQSSSYDQVPTQVPTQVPGQVHPAGGIPGMQGMGLQAGVMHQAMHTHTQKPAGLSNQIPSAVPNGVTAPYVERENQLRQEEELMQQDELRVQREIEERKQELKRREQELKKLEERLRQSSLESH